MLIGLQAWQQSRKRSSVFLSISLGKCTSHSALALVRVRGSGSGYGLGLGLGLGLGFGIGVRRRRACGLLERWVAA